MYIEFRNKKIEKICNNYETAKTKYNVTVAKKITQRLNEIHASKNFKIFCCLKIHNCHKLSGEYDGKFAVNLDKKNRLVFSIIAAEDLVNINFEDVLGIIVEEVVDYHG